MFPFSPIFILCTHMYNSCHIHSDGAENISFEGIECVQLATACLLIFFKFKPLSFYDEFLAV